MGIMTERGARVFMTMMARAASRPRSWGTSEGRGEVVGVTTER